MAGKFIVFSGALIALTACVRTVVEDADFIDVDGVNYRVQKVSFFESGSLGPGLIPIEARPSAFQVIVQGQPYQCGATVERCEDAVRDALRDLNNSNDSDGGSDGSGSSGGGGYGGGV
ncbi:MAG: hypothetical protein AAGF68_03295 [Pseudomonadota bacterium]